jgi:hypothetical protein
LGLDLKLQEKLVFGLVGRISGIWRNDDDATLKSADFLIAIASDLVIAAPEPQSKNPNPWLASQKTWIPDQIRG